MLIEEGENMLEEENIAGQNAGTPFIYLTPSNFKHNIKTPSKQANLNYFLVYLFVVGVHQPKKTRKLLTDEQKYAAYVAMHFLCMSNGGRCKRDDKKCRQIRS
jgi:hypothetical protein